MVCEIFGIVQCLSDEIVVKASFCFVFRIYRSIQFNRIRFSVGLMRLESFILKYTNGDISNRNDITLHFTHMDFSTFIDYLNFIFIFFLLV